LDFGYRPHFTLSAGQPDRHSENSIDGSTEPGVEQLTLGYGKLNETLDFYRSKTVLDFNAAAVGQFQTLLQQKIRTGTQDLRIAAIALSVGGIVVTRNQRDFQRVPGLRIEDWSS
jgi:tRNA(fMet)-specific endonuclease VapC